MADPAGVPGAIAAVLGVGARPGQTLSATLVDYLRRRAPLLVLDNCEHVAVACAELVAQLLAASPGLRVLATSRAALRLPGEVRWRVPPLALPPPELPTPTAVAASEAAQLLVDRIGLSAPGFALDARNAAAVAAICRWLDGLPLALELAAHVPTLSTSQLATRLDDALEALAGGHRGVPPRQRTLRATLDWSHGLLTDGERALFRRLAVFAGGCALEAAEVLGALAGLVDHSLVVAEPGTEGRATGCWG